MMRKIQLSIVLSFVVCLSATAYAALCSTGQQYYSNWQQAVINVTAEQQTLEFYEGLLTDAQEERLSCQDDVVVEMQVHGCNDPGECTTLSQLCYALDAAIIEEDNCQQDVDAHEGYVATAISIANNLCEIFYLHLSYCPNCD